MHVVETRGLTKDYEIGSFGTRRRRALDRLDLDVEEGEIFGLIGPNGAGKTTTLKLLMGLVFPTGGSATILGRAIGDREMKASIGYLPENPYFYDYLTGREILEYFGQLFGMARAERKSRAEELLAKVGMSESADIALRKYSKGMTQRLGVAQALVNRPKLVFLDEPMSGLDPVGRRDMSLLIRELHDSGVSVFFSSHILPDVENLCHRVAILNRGKLVESGRLDEILDVTTRSVEIVVENLAPGLESRLAERAGVYVSKAGERRRLSLSPSDADALLAEIAASGAQLVSVQRIKETLEDHFIEEVGTSAGKEP